jgi:gamma-glutamylcyclotransferase (GGCT)/AIG2-like uncharacterized protein YtfP
MNCNLFVYGTLRRDAGNEFAVLLSRSARLVGPGKVNGRLYEVADYPGLKLSADSSEWVHGDVYSLINHPGRTFQTLDEYEGCGPTDMRPHEFERVVVPVLMDSDGWIDAYVYAYARDVSEKRRIESGDFLVR